ncbi:hypothetical protein [Sphingomonas crocodyli]|uniref:hypothetical protein n=1 Tax=Sphingomonas crocodyli TaxID=1979270 RepID=UPI0013E308D8|nr:hypothetical protein [Sphingomonas crocodyli]
MRSTIIVLAGKAEPTIAGLRRNSLAPTQKSFRCTYFTSAYAVGRRNGFTARPHEVLASLSLEQTPDIRSKHSKSCVLRESWPANAHPFLSPRTTDRARAGCGVLALTDLHQCIL